jgi:hypothetical protein
MHPTLFLTITRHPGTWTSGDQLTTATSNSRRCGDSLALVTQRAASPVSSFLRIAPVFVPLSCTTSTADLTARRRGGDLHSPLIPVFPLIPLQVGAKRGSLGTPSPSCNRDAGAAPFLLPNPRSHLPVGALSRQAAEWHPRSTDSPK